MENTLCTAVNNGGDLSPVLFSKFERQTNVSLSIAPQRMSGGHSKKCRKQPKSCLKIISLTKLEHGPCAEEPIALPVKMRNVDLEDDILLGKYFNLLVM